MAGTPGIGRSIGRYQILRLLGEGGMGAVYLAQDATLERAVAIKVLRGGAQSPEWRERFWREARAAAQLHHPNVVTIFDVGEHRGRPFIAMEYIAGRTFAELIAAKAPLPMARKLEMLEGVCAGLAAAHAAGLIHRDVKPANLIVDADWNVKILDFGVARWADSNLTRADAVIGTLDYMAPEQVLGGAITHQVDLFAAAAVAYELLSYRRAFPEGLATAPTPLSSVQPGVPGSLEGAVARGLQWNPGARYPDALAFRDALSAERTRLLEAARGGPKPFGDATLADRPSGDRTDDATTAADRPATSLATRDEQGGRHEDVTSAAAPAVASVVFREPSPEDQSPARLWLRRAGIAGAAIALAGMAWFLISPSGRDGVTPATPQEASAPSKDDRRPGRVNETTGRAGADAAAAKGRPKPTSGGSSPRPFATEASRIADQASAQLAAGDQVRALAMLEDGLDRFSSEARLTALLDGMAERALGEAVAARTRAVVAGGESSPSFAPGADQLASAGRLTGGNRVRAYWSATRLLESARTAAVVLRPALPPASAVTEVKRAAPRQPESAPAGAESAGASHVESLGPGMLGADDESEVRQLLERWRRAIEADETTVGLAQFCPNLSREQHAGLNAMFIAYPSRSVSLAVTSITVSSRGVVTAHCNVKRAMRPKGGAQAERTINERLRFRLDAASGAWQIMALEGQFRYE
jgi:serine/threonine-protein kinase